MKFTKKKIATLNKCYALAHFEKEGQTYLICGAEKEDPTYLFDGEGNYLETICEGPGGNMTIEPFPGEPDVVLTTEAFYSPNNSAEAKIVIRTRTENGWTREVLCDLPFVHRFGILCVGEKKYIVACTLKSAHAFKDDWTCPGRIWVGEIDEDIRSYNSGHQLKLTALVSGLYRNHGFCKTLNNGTAAALVGADNGVYRVTAPHDGEDWKVEQLLEEKTSDMLYADFDGDGEKELVVFSPFHGEKLSVYHQSAEGFKEVWKYDHDLPFLHAIWLCEIDGRPTALVGNRQGDREFFALSYYDGAYHTDEIDRGAGATNAMTFTKDGKTVIMAANRETDEVALYIPE